MKKRLVWIFVFLVISLFIVSACEEIVGRKIYNANRIDDRLPAVNRSIQEPFSCNEDYFNI